MMSTTAMMTTTPLSVMSTTQLPMLVDALKSNPYLQAFGSGLLPSTTPGMVPQPMVNTAQSSWSTQPMVNTAHGIPGSAFMAPQPMAGTASFQAMVNSRV